LSGGRHFEAIKRESKVSATEKLKLDCDRKGNFTEHEISQPIFAMDLPQRYGLRALGSVKKNFERPMSKNNSAQSVKALEFVTWP
jgi:hypothetical protein